MGNLCQLQYNHTLKHFPEINLPYRGRRLSLGKLFMCSDFSSYSTWAGHEPGSAPTEQQGWCSCTDAPGRRAELIGPHIMFLRWVSSKAWVSGTRRVSNQNYCQPVKPVVQNPPLMDFPTAVPGSAGLGGQVSLVCSPGLVAAAHLAEPGTNQLAPC